MKRILLDSLNATLVVGNDREIRSLYKRMEASGEFYALFPYKGMKFRKWGTYGVLIDYDVVVDHCPQITVENADGVANILASVV